MLKMVFFIIMMNENEIQTKNNAVIHKDNSLNRLDLSFIKHIELLTNSRKILKNEINKESFKTLRFNY